MSDEITGRDNFILTEALATALVTLERLPDDRQPSSNMEDMKRLLAHFSPVNVSLALARSKCRLYPDLDPTEVYRSYGIDIHDERKL
jgi:hypothetical protein